MSELKNRAIQAANAFITRRGYEVLDEEWGTAQEDLRIDLVAKDENAIVFINVAARANGDSLPEESIDRKRLEQVAAQWLAAHPDSGSDTTIRFDAISMLGKRRETARFSGTTSTAWARARSSRPPDSRCNWLAPFGEPALMRKKPMMFDKKLR